MRRCMIVPIHLNYNPIKRAYDWHEFYPLSDLLKLVKLHGGLWLVNAVYLVKIEQPERFNHPYRVTFSVLSPSFSDSRSSVLKKCT
ncbi:hypothetical protein SAMN06298226_0049 [Nitrosovibrio sp. Nv4]|nr:hypothetical protein SAMN06298226_0049 [Nitrosovibrio sp. Nv4]